MTATFHNLHERKKPTSSYQNLCNIQSHYKSLLFIAVLLLLFYSFTVKYVSDNTFDDFVFTQRWLPSSCVEYEEKNGSSHNCILPDDYDVWVIHGLWPNKHNGFGPFFCNKSMQFNVTALEPILPQLKLNWPNIEKEKKGMSSLWKHEWYKHGTCAVELDSLNTEFKYFNQSLDFFEQFNMNNIFHQSDISPDNDNGVNVSEVMDLIESALGKNAYIHCITEVNTQKPFLSEIRICFDKNLKLKDCEPENNKFYMRGLMKQITNCPEDSPIYIPASVDFTRN